MTELWRDRNSGEFRYNRGTRSGIRQNSDAFRDEQPVIVAGRLAR